MMVPRKMMIVDGALRMIEPEEMPVHEYLRCWQKDEGIENGHEVCVISREMLQHLVTMFTLNTCA